MTKVDFGRRVEIRVAIGGFNKANLQINKCLLSMTYTDNEEDQADDLQLVLDDRELKWIRYWLTKNRIKRSRLDAVIVQKNWISTGRDKVLECGSFEIDTVDAAGPPSTVTLKATSLPYSPVRDQKKNKTWENYTLSGIAKEIGEKKNNLHVMFESVRDPKYKRKQQNNESDIAFLKRLCKGAGVSLKVTGSYLVLFDASGYENKNAVRTIKKGSSDIKSWRFSSKTADCAYSKCVVKYTDPGSGTVFEGSFTPNNAPADGQVLEVNEKVSSNEEAKTLAEKKLREKNKNENKAEITMMGDTNLVAGVTVILTGFGVYNGKYIIEKASHTVTKGYTVSLTLRRVLEGY